MLCELVVSCIREFIHHKILGNTLGLAAFAEISNNTNESEHNEIGIQFSPIVEMCIPKQEKAIFSPKLKLLRIYVIKMTLSHKSTGIEI